MGCCASTEEPVETIADAEVTVAEAGVTREEEGAQCHIFLSHFFFRLYSS